MNRQTKTNSLVKRNIYIWLWALGLALGCSQNQKPSQNQQAAINDPLAYEQQLVGKPIQDLIAEQITLIETKQNQQASKADIAALWQKLGTIFHAYELRNQAIAAYQKGLALTPDSLELNYLMAQVYQDQVIPEQATAFFKKSTSINPQHASSYFFLGELARSGGDLEGALDYYRKAIDVDQNLAVAFLAKGQVAFELGQLQEAKQAIETVLSLQPDIKRAYYQLAQIQKGLGNEDAATAALKKHESVEKVVVFYDDIRDTVDAYRRIGRNWIRRGDEALKAGQIGAALDAYRQAEGYEPRDFVAMARLGNAYLQNGEPQKARDNYQRAFEINPGNAMLQFNLGSSWMEEKAYEQGQHHFEKALELDSKLVDARMRLADSFRLRGMWSDALTQYQQCSADAPEFLSAAFGQAVSLLALERRLEAKNILENVWLKSDQNPVIGRILARMLASSPEFGVRDGAKALEILAIIRKKGPGPDFLETKAMALAETRAFEEAISTLGGAFQTATKKGDEETLKRLREQVSHYRAQKPWHKALSKDHPLFSQQTY